MHRRDQAILAMRGAHVMKLVVDLDEASAPVAPVAGAAVAGREAAQLYPSADNPVDPLVAGVVLPARRRG